jgi:hypothetical protein
MALQSVKLNEASLNCRQILFSDIVATCLSPASVPAQQYCWEAYVLNVTSSNELLLARSMAPMTRDV